MKTRITHGSKAIIYVLGITYVLESITYVPRITGIQCFVPVSGLKFDAAGSKKDPRSTGLQGSLTSMLMKTEFLPDYYHVGIDLIGMDPDNVGPRRQIVSFKPEGSARGGEITRSDGPAIQIDQFELSVSYSFRK